MARTGSYRGLAALAVMRLNEKDLRAFHEFVSEINETDFLEIVRDLEDEFDSSVSIVLGRNEERSYVGSEFDDLYRELDRLRRRELGMTVVAFSEAIAESVVQATSCDRMDVPRFDPRRGLQAWIRKLVRQFSEPDIYHAAMKIRLDRTGGGGSDWKLM